MIGESPEQNLYKSINIAGKTMYDPIEGDALYALLEMVKRIDGFYWNNYSFEDCLMDIYFKEDWCAQGFHIYVDDVVDIAEGRNYGGKHRWRAFPITVIGDMVARVSVTETLGERFLKILLVWDGGYYDVGEIFMPVDDLLYIAVLNRETKEHTIIWKRFPDEEEKE